MRVNKLVLYGNVAALTVSGLLLWLMLVKHFSPILAIMLFLGCLTGAVWCSCYVNGKLLPKKHPASHFYDVATKEVRLENNARPWSGRCDGV